MARQSEKHANLEKLRRNLVQRATSLQSDLLEIKKELEAVDTTIKLLKGFKGESETVAEVDQNEHRYYRQFAGLTQVEAMVKLAKDSGNNRFRLQDAKRILVGAGLVKSKKNANTILFTAIQRSEKFKRVAPGEYELLPTLLPSGYVLPLEATRHIKVG